MLLAKDSLFFNSFSSSNAEITPRYPKCHQRDDTHSFMSPIFLYDNVEDKWLLFENEIIYERLFIILEKKKKKQIKSKKLKK
jgi:hypothetical protein